MEINKKEIGRRIRGIRISRGFTLEDFGKILNADCSCICRWENGKTLPNKDRIYKISKFANITVNELLYGGSEQDIEEVYQQLIKLSDDEIIYIIKRVAKHIKERKNDYREH